MVTLCNRRTSRGFSWDAFPEANTMQVVWYGGMNLHKSNKCQSVTIICFKLSAIVEAQRVLFKDTRFPAHNIIFLILSQCQPSAITQLRIVVLYSLACVSVRVRGADWRLRVWRRGSLKGSEEDNVKRSKNINLKLIPLIFLSHLKNTKQIWVEDSISTPGWRWFKNKVNFNTFCISSV